METKNRSGFEEVRHTADLALRVWAPEINELFQLSAAGMQALMGVEISNDPGEHKTIEFSAIDDESLLAKFLNEILYWIEAERIASDHYDLEIKRCHLFGHCTPSTVLRIRKEIKAVTFHQLKVEHHMDQFETTIIFDV